MNTSVQTLSDLTIVIPAYCEEKRIGATLDELARFLRHDHFFSQKAVEVLVVSADTPDRTHQIVAAKQKLFKNLQLLAPGPKVGKGRDVQYGMVRAHGMFIIFMDADLATPLHHLKEFYAACERGNDIVVGTRNLLTYRSSLFRRLLSAVGNMLFRIAGGLWIEDSQCGFKMFNAPAAKLCFSKLTILGWSFDMEVLTIAKVNGMKTRSIRITDWQDVPNSTFRENILVTSLRSLADLGHIAKKRLNGSYITLR